MLRLPFSRQVPAESDQPPRGIAGRFAPILQQGQDGRGPEPTVSWNGASPKLHILTPQPVQCRIRSSNQLTDGKKVWAG